MESFVFIRKVQHNTCISANTVLISLSILYLVDKWGFWHILLTPSAVAITTLGQSTMRWDLEVLILIPAAFNSASNHLSACQRSKSDKKKKQKDIICKRWGHHTGQSNLPDGFTWSLVDIDIKLLGFFSGTFSQNCLHKPKDVFYPNSMKGAYQI